MNPMNPLLTFGPTLAQLRYWWGQANEAERGMIWGTASALFASIAQLIYVTMRASSYHWLTVLAVVLYVVGFAGFLRLTVRFTAAHIRQRQELDVPLRDLVVRTTVGDSQAYVRSATITTADGTEHTFEYRRDTGWEQV